MFLCIFGHQMQLSSPLWMIYVETHNNMIQFKQIKQNNPDLLLYKGSTCSQTGQKSMKICEN